MKRTIINLCPLALLLTMLVSCFGGEEICFRARPLRCPTAASTYRFAPDYPNAYRRISQPLPTYVRSWRHYQVGQPRPRSFGPNQFATSWRSRVITPSPFPQGDYCDPIPTAGP